MVYLILFLVVILVNSIPFFAPPTWGVLVLFFVRYKLEITLVVLFGVFAATLGRYILSYYINKFADLIFNKKAEENLGYLGEKLGKTQEQNFIFTFLYSLTPLSTNALFIAVSMAKLKIKPVIAGFFCGRLVSYTVLILTTGVVAKNISDLLSGVLSIKNIIATFVGLIVLLGFIFIDWKTLFIYKHLRLDFKVWRWCK